MKKLDLMFLCLSLFLLAPAITSQQLGNEGYKRSNRYVQNVEYNKDLDFTVELSKHKKESLYNIDKGYTEIEINALYNARADSYLAILSIIQNGETAASVDNLVNLRYKGFCNDLAQFGVKKDDIFIDMISLIPIYQTQLVKKLFSKTYNEVPAGFKLQKNIHVYFEKADVLDEILTVAAKHEIYDLIKVEYFVKNTQQIYDSLANVSIEAVNQKVKRLKKLGVVLDTLKHVYMDKKSVLFPVDRYKPYNSYGGLSLTSKKGETINTSKKTPTMFYNKIPYHKYDIIINPSFIEPTVQYSYNLVVRYYLKPDESERKTEVETKIKNIYHIITPQGDVKKLNTD